MKRCIVTVGANIGDENFGLICERLKNKLGDDIEIVRKLDGGIIGGFILNIDGMIYDMSISGQLAEIQKHLKGE